MGRRWRIVAFVVCVVCLRAAPARAAIDVADWSDDDDVGSLELAGYARFVAGPLIEPPLPLDAPDVVGLDGQALRLKWKANLSEEVTLDLHQELSWQLASQPSLLQTGGLSIGLGASRQPDRTLQTQLDLIDEPGARLTHDIDRAAVTWFGETFELKVGRQGITWGKAGVFPVADLWTTFSPFELDTTHKPGIDAARLLYFTESGGELDIVVADRGSVEDLSGGVRFAQTVGDVDVYGAVAKQWMELMAMGGATWVLDKVRLRAEVNEPYDLASAEFQLPRGTLGAEWFPGPDWRLLGEYHFNGAGARRAGKYLEVASQDVAQRGEIYLLGRHYGGASVSYLGVTELTLTVSALTNVLDPSVLVAPLMRYRTGPNISLGVGGYIGVGERLDTSGALPELRSEFGTTPSYLFTEFVGYF
jgi:hypothetical protein